MSSDQGKKKGLSRREAIRGTGGKGTLSKKKV